MENSDFFVDIEMTNEQCSESEFCAAYYPGMLMELEDELNEQREREFLENFFVGYC